MIEDPNFNLQLSYSDKEPIFSSFSAEGSKMVIAVREDLKMGKGKIAAQVGHAGIVV